jgi:hypothetical protein
MKRMKLYLIALGALCFLSALSGIASFSTGSAGTVIGYHSSLLSRAVAAAYGAILLWLAYGIHRRLPAAWRVGIFGLVAGWFALLAYVSFFIAHDPQPYGPHARLTSVALIMAAASLAFLYWGRRWYKSRSYFLEPHEG